MGVPEALNELKNDIDSFTALYNNLKKENEELKKKNDELKKELDWYKVEADVLGRKLDEYTDY